MIKIVKTPLAGLYLLSNALMEDGRGTFRKVFSSEEFQKLSLKCDFKEMYYSSNNKNVIRGMHFQSPPYEYTKLVYVIQGGILDVCLDLRKYSKTFKKYFSVTMTSSSEYLYIPPGIAHGFAVLEENTIVHYAQDKCYSEKHDLGIMYNSFGFDWNIENPVLSRRDTAFPPLSEFNSMFD